MKFVPEDCVSLSQLNIESRMVSSHSTSEIQPLQDGAVDIQCWENVAMPSQHYIAVVDN